MSAIVREPIPPAAPQKVRWSWWHAHRYTSLPQLVLDETLPAWRKHYDAYMRANAVGRDMLRQLQDARPFVVICRGGVRLGKTHASIGLADWLNRQRGLDLKMNDYVHYSIRDLVHAAIRETPDGKDLQATYETHVLEEAESDLAQGHHDEDKRQDYLTALGVRGKTQTNICVNSSSKATYELLKEQARYIFRFTYRRGLGAWKTPLDLDWKKSIVIKDEYYDVAFPPLCRELADQYAQLEGPGKVGLLRAAKMRMDVRARRETSRLQRRLAEAKRASRPHSRSRNYSIARRKIHHF